ncbi:hypothetical protein [Paractinoplanes globisporus]|uniref:TetR family transcriptional regulator n=1 Tax=Paractinoplanes globisporus TaxID=113565 RepID=A0ABW6WXP7_9ACTN|nr:hypothetical protein [Actinoplanes globisporus]
MTMSEPVTPARLLGQELAEAAEKLLIEVRRERPDPADAVRLATVQALLALYWEVRHQSAGDAAPGLERISALLSGPPAS